LAFVTFSSSLDNPQDCLKNNHVAQISEFKPFVNVCYETPEFKYSFCETYLVM